MNEYWRRKGYELVMRLGTDEQRMGAAMRLAEFKEIRRMCGVRPEPLKRVGSGRWTFWLPQEAA